MRLACRGWRRSLDQTSWAARPHRCDAATLSRFPSIRWLALSNCSLRVVCLGERRLGAVSSIRDADLGALASLRHLTALSLYNCPGIRGHGLYQLAACPRLRQLNLGKCTGLEEEHMAALLLLPELQSLGLHQCPRLGDGALVTLCQHPTLSVILAPSGITGAGVKVCLVFFNGGVGRWLDNACRTIA